jgi:hypothetical protein
MDIGCLNSEEIDYINQALSENGGMNPLEYENLKYKHPYIVIKGEDALILTSMKYYGMHDSKFNSFIVEKFGKPEYEIDFFYELIYDKGNLTKPHRDKYFVLQTTLILLSNEFVGGRLIIDGEDVNFTEIGQYVNFEGNNQVHQVTQLESGQRRVLVIMFNKKRTSLI